MSVTYVCVWTSRFRDFAWAAYGELGSSFTSHAKWAVGTSEKIFVAGGMNQQGFPCSSSCSGRYRHTGTVHHFVFQND